jgi:hypothetical protein
MSKLKQHKKSSLKKFIFVTSILFAYAAFSINQFGLKHGILVTILSWSFFVLCTPIADAGFLLDFPMRLVTGIRMFYSEIIVWILAITANLIILAFHPIVYEKTQLLQLSQKVLTNPWPFWSIIVLSAIGTFASVILDDDLYDIAKSKNKKRFFKKEKMQLYFTIGTFVITFALYFLILKYTHISIKIF